MAGCTTTNIDSQAISPTQRPLDLIAGLQAGPLRDKLASCEAGPFYRSDFSIGHRGAPFGYPEHTVEGYTAAAAMGAGFIECDVTFTKDLALVCRHSQCDLHRTTNILQTPLAASCTSGFSPATLGGNGSSGNPASAQCCTSDITLAEFQTLCGRRDIVNDTALNVADYLTAPTSKLVDSPTICGALMTHSGSIRLIDKLGANFIPELKNPAVKMPFKGMTQADYASRLIQEYEVAGIPAHRVRPQAFSVEVVKYWLQAHPEFGKNAVYLDPRGRQPDFVASLEDMQALKEAGISILAPPMSMLLTLDSAGELQPSDYAKFARQAGLKLVTWTFESGQASDPNNWLYANISAYMDNESRMLEVLDALHNKVGISGIFSDWPGTVTYYANCQGL